jgi:hypothetical protein
MTEDYADYLPEGVARGTPREYIPPEPGTGIVYVGPPGSDGVWMVSWQGPDPLLLHLGIGGGRRGVGAGPAGGQAAYLSCRRRSGACVGRPARRHPGRRVPDAVTHAKEPPHRRGTGGLLVVLR